MIRKFFRCFLIGMIVASFMTINVSATTNHKIKSFEVLGFEAWDDKKCYPWLIAEFEVDESDPNYTRVLVNQVTDGKVEGGLAFAIDYYPNRFLAMQTRTAFLYGSTHRVGYELTNNRTDRDRTIYDYVELTITVPDTCPKEKPNIPPYDSGGTGGNQPPSNPPAGGNLPPTKDWGAVDNSKPANACGGGRWASPIRNWVDNIFCPIITFLDLARSKLAAVSLMMGQGLNIGKYFKIFGDLPTSWQLVVSSLLLMVVTLGGLLIYRSAMRIYYSIKEGVKWW